MHPKYCSNCGTKAESSLAKFCSSCATPLNGIAAKAAPKMARAAQEIDDDPDATDATYVPVLSELSINIEEDDVSEYPGFSQAQTFSITQDGTQVSRKFKPRRL